MKLLASNNDGDKQIELLLCDNGAHVIYIGNELVEFGLNQTVAFKNFGEQIMWALIRKGAIERDRTGIQ